MQLFQSPPNRNVAPVVIPQDVPVYRVDGSGFYCDDELLASGTIIQYDDEPNQDMIPLNEVAVKRMREFLIKLDNLGRKKSVQEKTAFISALDAFDKSNDQSKSTGRRANVLGAPKETSILGAKRKYSRASKIEVQALQEPIIIDKRGERNSVNAVSEPNLD